MDIWFLSIIPRKRLRQYEETIRELNKQNKDLVKQNEYLKTLKIKPTKLLTDIEILINNGINAISQIKEYCATMQKTDFVMINPDKLIIYKLRPNEKRILEGILSGKTYQEIADEVFLAEGSVKNLAAQVFKKFGVKNRKEMETFIINNLAVFTSDNHSQLSAS